MRGLVCSSIEMGTHTESRALCCRSFGVARKTKGHISVAGETVSLTEACSGL